MAAATIVMTFWLARALTGDSRLARCAAGFLALDPVAIQYANLLLTEVYTSCLLTLFLATLIQYTATERPRWLVLGGAVLAVGVVTHPILLFLPFSLIALPVAILVNERGRSPYLVPDTAQTRLRSGTLLRRVAGRAGFGSLAAALALAPAGAWVVRNALVGDFVGISSVTAVNLLKYKAAGVEAELHGTTREIERDRLTRTVDAELPPDASPGERYRRWQQVGTGILLAHPWIYAEVHVRGMLLELFGPERDHTTRLLFGPAVLDTTGRYTDDSIAAARRDQARWPFELAREALLGWQAVLIVLLLLGGWQLVRQRRAGLLTLLLSLPLYVLLLSGGPEASPRFRVLYLPSLAILAAYGWQALRQCWLRTSHSIRGPLPFVSHRAAA